jgi:hypothetical protein
MTDNFKSEVKRIAQAIAFGADVSQEDPLMVAAAEIYLRDQSSCPTEKKIPLQDSSQ